MIVSCEHVLLPWHQYYHENPAIFDRATAEIAIKEVIDFMYEIESHRHVVEFMKIINLQVYTCDRICENRT